MLFYKVDKRLMLYDLLSPNGNAIRGGTTVLCFCCCDGYFFLPWLLSCWVTFSFFLSLTFCNLFGLTFHLDVVFFMPWPCCLFFYFLMSNNQTFEVYLRSDMSFGALSMTYSRSLLRANNEVFLLHLCSKWQKTPRSGIEHGIRQSWVISLP